MSVWLIQPRDPLIFRDGKPFNATPGAQATSLPFPYPSVLAGGMRTRAGQNEAGWFNPNQPLDRLRRLSIRGPILARIDVEGRAKEWYLPAPADCLVTKSDDEFKGQRYWAHPVAIPAGAATNLAADLLLVSANPVVKGKPHKKPPRFWTWRAMRAWLVEPANDTEPMELMELGISGLTAERRVHVRIDAETGTAQEGFLFQTSGLEFAAIPGEGKIEPKVLSKLQQYALVVETDADLREGVAFLGGERRMVNWKKSDTSLPVCPDRIRQAIVKEKHCRLVLATPAIFQQGYLPEWVCHASPDLTVGIRAAAVPRYAAVSGWDAAKHRSKASRRLAPAGSVYYLSLDGDETAINQFIDNVWMQTLSDAEQDRRDGFGLALLGVWDGEVEKLEVKV